MKAIKTIKFRLDFEPIPQPRPKFRVFKNGKRQAYFPEGHPVNEYRRRLAEAARDALPDGWIPPDDVPVTLSILFVLPRPKWLNRTKGRGKNKRPIYTTEDIPAVRKPDTKNLITAVEDALSRVVWHDDDQVVHIDARKVWGGLDESPHVVIEVEIGDTLENDWAYQPEG